MGGLVFGIIVAAAIMFGSGWMSHKRKNRVR